MSTPKPNRNNGPAFHLFDIRNIIGALLEIYGVVLLIAGVAPNILADRHDDAVGNRVNLYIGTDANWWVGVVLLGVAAIFFAWAYFRPVHVEETSKDE